MSKKSAAQMKKVDEAVQILNTTTGVNVPMAMTLAGFPKKETTNKTVRRMICCCLEAVQAKQSTPPADAVRIVTNDSTDLSPLTGKDDDPSTTMTSNATTTGPTHP
jgi:hypothetical protein